MPPDQSYWGAVGRATLGGTLGGAAGGFLFRALAPSLGLMTRNAERQMQTAGLDCSIGAGSRATSYAGHASLGGLGGGVGYGLGTLATGGQLDADDKNKYVAARAKMLLEKLTVEKELPASYPYPIQTWQLGDLTWLHLGGEVVVDYSLRFKKDHGAAWVTAYANDVMAYIPSARVLKEGGYEGGGAMVYYGLPSVWGKDVEDLIAAEAARQVKAVRRK